MLPPLLHQRQTTCNANSYVLPAEQFGRTEASYTIIRMLQTFDKIENMEAPGPIKLHHSIEIRSGTGVQVRLHEAATSKRGRGVDDLDFELEPPRRESVH